MCGSRGLNRAHLLADRLFRQPRNFAFQQASNLAHWHFALSSGGSSMPALITPPIPAMTRLQIVLGTMQPLAVAECRLGSLHPDKNCNKKPQAVGSEKGG